ncbi:MAG: uroporphyrinogen-III synthase [Fibrobacteria bacterium]|nr:uroporphyrinogen-III synthase [Fibrobacteria bacterium]
MSEIIRILNTRPAAQAASLTSCLQDVGFEVIELPLIQLSPLTGITRPVPSPASVNGLFFSSVHGIEFFFPKLDPMTGATSATEALKTFWLRKPVYTISAKVVEKIKAYGGKVDFCSKEAGLQGFLKEFRPAGPCKWLHPCSDVTRLNPEDFARKKVVIANYPVYTPAIPSGTAEKLVPLLPRINAIVFTSGSMVHNFFECLQPPTTSTSVSVPDSLALFSIGPSASEALRHYGVENFEEATKANNEGLLRCLKNYYQNKP